MKSIHFILIFILGFILRFVFLGEVPVSMHRDELFFGYNAYSILLTGNDISGHFLPLHLESFFMSPAGYSYLVMPFIAIFGLAEFAVRLPSAIFGLLTIPLVYLLAVSLFEKNKNRHLIGLFSSFVFAISPWHINLSRVATENVVVTFLIVLGTVVYIKYIRNKRLLILLFSFISFAATLVLYQAPRAFLPLFLPLLFFYSYSFKKLFKIKLEYVLYVILIIIPVILILFSPHLSWRISSLSVFNHSETQLVINEQLTNDSVQDVPYLISRIFHNKVVGFGLLISENFFKHLSFDFLFTDSGFPDRYRIPNMGLLYLFELPLILLALFSIFNSYRKIGVFLVGWIVLGISGSALTMDDIPNLQRTLMMVPAFSILSGYGGFILYEFLKKQNPIIKKLSLLIIIIIILYSISYYLIQYYVQAKVYRPWYRQDGYKELVSEVNSLLPYYDGAVITDRESTPAIFFMFYTPYEPEKLQEETKNLDMQGAGDIPFGKYTFTDKECPVRYEKDENGEQMLIGEDNILYVNSGLCEEIPEEANVITEVKRVDGSTAFIILGLE